MPLFLLVCIALVAFAGNSVLCRLALSQYDMDATSFTLLRLVSGAFTLYFLVRLKGTTVFPSTHRNVIKVINKQDWLKAFYLFIYAAGFSFAYKSLDTAAGALILFGCVQFTLLTVEILNGKSLNLMSGLGMALGLSGFVYWALPSAQAPSLGGAIIMAMSGIAWAFYTLAGRRSQQADIDTAKSFILSLPFLVILIPCYWFIGPMQVNTSGIILALASGSITSALGYWIWYLVLPKLTTLSAGVLQLSVPILAALGGIIWAGEFIPLSFVIASALILSGILLVLMAAKRTV